MPPAASARRWPGSRSPRAKNSSVPLLFLASGTPPLKNGSAATGQCDQQALFAPVTKATYRVEDEEGVGLCLNEAIRSAASPRLGPVFVEIAADVRPTDSRTAPVLEVALPASIIRPADPPMEPDPPVARGFGVGAVPGCAGGRGCPPCACYPSTVEIRRGGESAGGHNAEWQGRVPEGHSLALGVVGAKGHLFAEQRFREFGTVLVLGSKLGDKTCSYGGLFAHWPTDHPRRQRPRRPPPAYRPLRPRTCGSSTRPGEDHIGDHRPSLAGRGSAAVTAILASRADGDAVSASGNHPRGGHPRRRRECRERVGRGAIRLLLPNQRLLTPRGSGSLGFALPAAIGAVQGRIR